ncbi:CopG family transcriptional regulator [Sphingomonas sp. BGYR3]|uniref:CopG family transcriptional regulator n=1 Tax=Sphingomonas sp. BGYR3 TaxID=2975483 RepID=UPI0021A67BB6|nr:CopG family transcriptional regulator [Sphingomonas sp. BGYR3]MDG5488879.1 CopG family transcriptional regulator [Sphingomonas sp. BGYR3]
MKVRQNLYIDRELSDALEALAAGTAGNKSRLVNDALADWLSRRGTKQVDDLLKLRLDRISREIGNARRDIDVLLESLSLFVRYQLMVTAPLPDADAAAIAVGRDRFEKFVAQVGRQLAAGKRSIGHAPDLEDPA